MEIELTRKTLSAFRQVYRGTQEVKLRSDIVVPDTMEDAEKLLMGDMGLRIDSKELIGDKIIITGIADAVCLYVPESGDGIMRLGTEIPFEYEFGTQNYGELSFVNVSVHLSDLRTKLINSRKLSVEASVLVDMALIADDALTWYEKPSQEMQGVFYKEKTQELNIINNAAEKSFSVDGEIELPEGTDNTEVLFFNTEYHTESAEPVGSKLIIKCRAETEFLLNIGGKLSLERKSLLFSQIFDNPEREEMPECEVTVIPNGRQYEKSENSLYYELSGTMQLVCTRTNDVKYVSDAYVCRKAYELGSETVNACTSRKKSTQTVNSRLTEQVSHDVNSVIYGRVLYGEAKQSDSTVTVPVSADGMYSDGEGHMHAFKLKRNIEFELNEPQGRVSIDSAAMKCTVNGNELVINTELEVSSLRQTEEKINMVRAISAGDERNTGESVIHLCPSDRELWELAKAYDSDPGLILKLNSDESGKLINDRLLIIPSI